MAILAPIAALAVIAFVLFGIPLLLGYFIGFWWGAIPLGAWFIALMVAFIRDQIRRDREIDALLKHVRSLPVDRQRAIFTDVLFNIQDPKESSNERS